MKGITPKFRMLCFVLMNSTLLNLLCVWIRTSGQASIIQRQEHKTAKQPIPPCRSPHLNNSAQVTVGGQFQTLLLRPSLDTPQAPLQAQAPESRAELQLRLHHQDVEEPHVDEVEQLREELNGQRCIDTATAQQGHGC